MKRIFKKSVFIFLGLFLLSSLAFAETIKISGGQTAGTGPFRDAGIKSDPVELPSDGKITKVEGSHRGFWINEVSRWGRETKLAGFSSSDEAIGYFLKAGTYTVYPNVPEHASGADVTLYVEVGGEIAKRKYSEKGVFNRELAQKLEKITKEAAQKLEWKYEGEVMQEYVSDRYAKGDRSWVAMKEGGFIGDSQDGPLYGDTFTLSVYLSAEVKRCSEKELREVMNNWQEEVINYREIISTSVGPAINFGYSYKGKTKPKDSICPYDSIQLHRSNYVITVGASNCTQSTKYIKKGLTKQIFEGILKHFPKEMVSLALSSGRKASLLGTIIARGRQIKGTGPFSNAKLIGEPFKIPAGGAEIVKARCTGKGFWIRGVSRLSFYESFNRANDAIGFRLPQGEYVVYPNLDLEKRLPETTVYLELLPQ